MKEVVGAHVEQKGSVVEPDRLRFDYSHSKPLSDDEIISIEEWVNTRIRHDAEVIVTEGVSLDEAKAQGVVALFGEKYGDEVRTVRAGSESFELCGGTMLAEQGNWAPFELPWRLAVLQQVCDGSKPSLRAFC